MDNASDQVQSPNADPVIAAGGSPAPVERDDLNGISGWLAFFALGNCVGLAIGLFIFISSLSSLRDLKATFGPTAWVVTEDQMALGVQALLIGGVATGLVLLFRKSRYAPRYWTLFLLASVLLVSMQSESIRIVETEMARLQRVELPPDYALTQNGNLDRNLILLVIWCGYWIGSKRVRATFGYSGLGRLRWFSLIPKASKASKQALAAPMFQRKDLLALGAGLLLSAVLALPLISVESGPTRQPTTHADSVEQGGRRMARAYQRHVSLLDGLLPLAPPGTSRHAQVKAIPFSDSSVLRVDDTVAAQWSASIGRAWAALPESNCAAYGRGRAGDGDRAKLDTAVMLLDSATQDSYAFTTYALVAAELRHLPPRRTDTRILTEARTAFAAALGPEQTQRMQAILRDPSAASDTDECWALVTLYTIPAKLPPLNGGALVRAILVP